MYGREREVDRAFELLARGPGALLTEAQKTYLLALHPWLLIPGLFIVAVVLAFNFVGDGVRDAAAPYAHV